MPRKLRVQYEGDIYHVMDRGNRREDIFLDDVDRQDFLKTLAEACQKTGFEIHAERIIAEELKRLGWSEVDLMAQRKKAPGKLDLAARPKREMIIPLKWIAARVHLGTSKSANSKLHDWMKKQKTTENALGEVVLQLNTKQQHG